MKIPVVLPVVHISVDDEGTLTVDIDGDPYDTEESLFRRDLQTVLDTITTGRESAVRVDIRESDNTTYADIATPPAKQPETAPEHEHAAPSPPGICGSGFRPGEAIAVAYVLLRGTADAGGGVAVHLPPSALAGRAAAMVMMGLDSKVATLVEVSP